MTYPTLRQKLLGKSDWRSTEIKVLAERLKFSPAEIYALTVEQSVPEETPAQSAGEAWRENHDGYPLEDDPVFFPFQSED